MPAGGGRDLSPPSHQYLRRSAWPQGEQTSSARPQSRSRVEETPSPGRVGGVGVAGDSALDQPIGSVGGVEDLVLVVHAERREVDRKVVLVLHREADLRNLRP